MISIALVPRGENPAHSQFIRKTIHRPASIPIRNLALDSGMQTLMNGEYISPTHGLYLSHSYLYDWRAIGLDSLNVSFGQMGGSDGKDDNDEVRNTLWQFRILQYISFTHSSMMSSDKSTDRETKTRLS